MIEDHGSRGIHPQEGLALNRLWDAAVNRVTTIPDAEIEKMAKAGTPEGQSVPPPLDAHEKTTQERIGHPPECAKCFDEFGSYACVRPAHKTADLIGG
jgi:hypothetical protein